MPVLAVPTSHHFSPVYNKRLNKVILYCFMLVHITQQVVIPLRMIGKRLLKSWRRRNLYPILILLIKDLLVEILLRMLGQSDTLNNKGFKCLSVNHMLKIWVCMAKESVPYTSSQKTKRLRQEFWVNWKWWSEPTTPAHPYMALVLFSAYLTTPQTFNNGKINYLPWQVV